MAHENPAATGTGAPAGALLEQTAHDPDRLILLRGGAVLTMDPDLGDLVGDVLIRGSRIAAVGPDLSAAAAGAIEVDATGTVVLPGFVDAHVHAWQGQLRGLAPTIDLETYMALVHGRLAPVYRPDDIRIGTLVTALAALDAGVTTVVDNAHNARSPEHSDAAVAALHEAGIRGVHATGAPLVGDASGWLADVERLRDEQFRTDDQLLTLRLMDVYPSTEVWRFARDHDLWVSTEMGAHVTNLARLHDAGLLTAQHTLNHCAGLTEIDWDLIAASGVAVNLCPRSDAQFGLGRAFPPVDEALRHGIRPGLSRDTETSYGASMIAEMQALLTLHRGRIFARRHAGDPEGPPHLTLRDVLEFATLGGAHNAGLAGRVGVLRPGAEADVILLRADSVHALPLTNALATAVQIARPSDVDTVLVAGQVRKWGGELVDIDLAAVRATATRSRDALLAAAGLRPDLFGELGYREAQLEPARVLSTG